MKFEKTCEYCGAKYISGGKTSKYCSNAHRARAYEQRKGKKPPAFLTKPTVSTKTIFKVIEADRTKPKESAIGMSVLRDVNKLENDRAYYYNFYHQLSVDNFPYATIAGAILFSQILGKENRTVGAITGGVLGYALDKKMIINKAQEVEKMKSACVQKIKEIDKMLAILKASELKEAVKPHVKGEEKVEWNNGILSAIAVNKQNIPSYELSEPYSSFLGHPTQNFSAIIYGLPKSGKSHFAIQFASYLVKQIGKVLYFASEEGIHSKTLQDKIRYNLAENKDLYFSGATELEQMKKDIKSDDYKFVFVDSINRSNLSADDLEKLKSENKDKAFISVLQSTKGGNFKGAQDFAHNCDVVIEVADGIASQVGRFSPPSQMVIFPSNVVW